MSAGFDWLATVDERGRKRGAQSESAGVLRPLGPYSLPCLPINATFPQNDDGSCKEREEVLDIALPFHHASCHV